MVLNTCAQVISLAKRLENEGAKYYQALALRYPDNKEMFLSLARENDKNIVAIERAYYGVITDAIEGCFAFQLEPDKYTFSILIPETKKEVLSQAVAMEEIMIKFYTDAAEQGSLMADVPRAFSLVARKRASRIPQLRSLANG